MRQNSGFNKERDLRVISRHMISPKTHCTQTKMRMLNIVTKTLAILMLLAGMLLLLRGENYVIAFESIAGSIASILLFYTIDKLQINKYYKLFVVVAISLHLIGATNLFNNFIYYDKLLHLVFAIFLTLMVSDWFNANLSSKKRFLEVFMFLSLVGIFGVWEILEYSGDVLFLNFQAQGVYNSLGEVITSPIDDTMQDMIISSTGAIATLFVIASKKLKR